MSKERKTLALISRPIVDKWGRGEASFGYEARHLIRAGRETYGNVLLINPFLISVELPRGSDTPRLLHEGALLPAIDSLIVRSTHKLGDSLSATVRSLRLLGCDILDRLASKASRGSKLTTSISRFKMGVGSSTFLAFSREGALDLAGRLGDADRFPLITKPIDGRGRKGVLRLDTPDDLGRHVRTFYRRKSRATLLLQSFEEFTSEFRVMLFFGQPLGIARKIPAEGAVAANAAQGGTFVPADRPDAVCYAVENVDSVGILGVDVGETGDGEFRIIEANRAPRWQAFDTALGCDTAKTIVTLARERLD